MLGLGSSEPKPAAISIPGPPLYNQLSTSSCVGQAIKGDLHTLEYAAAQKLGLPDPEGPSALYIYAYARLQNSAILLDRGTFIRSAAEACRKMGVPDESAWPFSTRPWRVNRRPSWRAHMMAEPRHGISYYRILSTGAERIESIQRSLIDGFPVVFGTRVDDMFLYDVGPDFIGPPTGEIVGGHAMLITGYEETPSGLVFRVRNSWGSDWRAGGYCYFTEDYMRAPYTRDFTVFKGWKRLRSMLEID